jgi:hypothetical protein
MYEHPYGHAAWRGNDYRTAMAVLRGRSPRGRVVAFGLAVEG